MKPKPPSLPENSLSPEDNLKQVIVSLASVSREERKKEASKPLYLTRYE